MSHLEEFAAHLGFPMDPFQEEGCQAVEEGHGVLVCAPTGAGKTVVGEFAVSLALSRGTKCFYTTPIKALSNQKYHDLVDTYGEERVGLLTGDVSINGSAEVVVMTTEVLRNMIYAGSSTLDRLSHVVMDEIHFLADASRGAVWEEVILNLPDYISIIGLSATVSNSEEFGRWLSSVRGDTKVIVSEHRPVPLDQWMLFGKELHPLFKAGDSATPVNPNLVERVENTHPAFRDGHSFNPADDAPFEYVERPGFRSRSRRGRKPVEISVAPSRSPRPLGRPEAIRLLYGQGMLPAIVFIFSRAGCDGAVMQCLGARLELSTHEEASQITSIIDQGVADIPQEELEVLDFRRWRTALMRGFAAHHAGMLPAFRHIVEELFVKGLLKVVFATETLALGINMPARTVLLEKLVKFNGEAHVDLTPGQYTQLTGRAGRRGIDTIGNAVVQWAPGMDPREVAGLASTRTYPLISTFAPGYNMSVNLVNTIGFEAATRLISRSFAQFQTDAAVVDVAAKLERARASATKAQEAFHETAAAIVDEHEDVQISPEEILSYVDLRRQISEAERDARSASLESNRKEILTCLRRLEKGEIVAIPSKKQKRPLQAIVLQAARDHQDPRPLFVFKDGSVKRLGLEEFEVAPLVLGRGKGRLVPKSDARHALAILRRTRLQMPKKMRVTPRFRPNKKVTALREEMRQHPAHRLPKDVREHLASLAHNVSRERAAARRLAREVESDSGSLIRNFQAILELLENFGYVSSHSDAPGDAPSDDHSDAADQTADQTPTQPAHPEAAADEDSEQPTRIVELTDAGHTLARIHAGADLLIAECLEHRVWEGLDPAELAGVVSLCTFENRRDRGFFNDDAPTEAMAEAMNETTALWANIARAEEKLRLPLTPQPQPHFALAAHQWTAGAPLDYCLGAAAACGAELSPGDFVRTCRQLVDVLQQINAVAGEQEEEHAQQLAKTARRAINAIRRSVVAIGR